MIELIFIVCLKTNPTWCEEKSMSFVETSTHACLMGAQPQLARWNDSHPRWRIVRWKCEAGPVLEREA